MIGFPWFLMTLIGLISVVKAITTEWKASPFKRIFIVVLENQSLKKVMRDPYMGTELVNKGRLLTQYKAVTHPSQPNYIAMVAGSTFEVHTDRDYDLFHSHVGDVLEEQGFNWKTYQVI